MDLCYWLQIHSLFPLLQTDAIWEAVNIGLRATWCQCSFHVRVFRVWEKWQKCPLVMVRCYQCVLHSVGVRELFKGLRLSPSVPARGFLLWNIKSRHIKHINIEQDIFPFHSAIMSIWKYEPAQTHGSIKINGIFYEIIRNVYRVYWWESKCLAVL